VDKGLLLSLFLILIAWVLVISGLYLIAEALVPIEGQGKLSRRIAGILKVVGAFLLLGSLLYMWFLLTKYLVARIKTKSQDTLFLPTKPLQGPHKKPRSFLPSYQDPS